MGNFSMATAIIRSSLISRLLGFALLFTPGVAWAQCAGGQLANCPAAVNPQSTDLVYGWQPGQSPHSRSFTVDQLGSAAAAASFASPPVLGSTAANQVKATALNATGAATLSGGGSFAGTFTGNHTYSGNLTFQGTSALNGATTIGTNSAAATTNLTGPASSNRFLQWTTAGSPRWDFRTDSTAESGSNAGSRLILDRRSDAGSLNGAVLTVDRRWGAMQMLMGSGAVPVVMSGNDPGTLLNTMGFRWDQFYTGTTTGTPLTFNQLWVRDTVNDSSQGVIFGIVADTGCASGCSPDLSFNGTIVGNQLTVNSVTSGTATAVGDAIAGSGVIPTHIQSFGTGTGGVGTYTLDNAFNGTVGPEAMTSTTPISTQGRQAISTTVNATGPITAPGGVSTYNGARFGVSASGDGGATMTKRGPSTQAFNYINSHLNGGVNWDNISGMQGNLYAISGENFAQRSHIALNTASDQGGQAGQSDAFMVFAVSPTSNPGLTAPYYGLQQQSLITLGNNGGSIFPLDANNGEIISATQYLGALISPRPAMQSWRGFDLAGVQFSDCVFCLAQFRLANNGDTFARRLLLTDLTNGPSIDVGCSVASVTGIASSGNGFKNGEIYPTRLGGAIQVTGVTGSTVNAAAYVTGMAPCRKSGDVVQVAWTFAQNTAASGQPVIAVRNSTISIAPGDTVVALGPSAACNAAIPGGTTVSSFNNGVGGIGQTLTLSANLTANMTYGCMLSMQRTMPETTDTIMVGSTGNFKVNITWTAPTAIQIGANAGELILGSGSELATNATTGFTKIQTTNGAPTGICGGAAGKACLVVDRSNKKLCYNISGTTWECSSAFTP